MEFWAKPERGRRARSRAKPKDADEELEGNALPVVALDYQELDEFADKPINAILGKDVPAFLIRSSFGNYSI